VRKKRKKDKGTYSLGEMRGESDEGPGELRARIALEIASTHEMETGWWQWRVFEDGEKGKCCVKVLLKVLGEGCTRKTINRRAMSWGRGI